MPAKNLHGFSPSLVQPRGVKHADSTTPSTISVEFPYRCIPSPRPRIVHKGNRRFAYMPAQYERWKQDTALLWRQATRGSLADPEFSPERARSGVYSVEIGIRGPMRGDLDNYAKSVLDALSGVAYPDDSVRWIQDLRVQWLGGGNGFDVSITRHQVSP